MPWSTSRSGRSASPRPGACLSARLGLSLPRRLLHRIVEYTEGNPLFALELGRTVVEQGMPAIGADIEVSDAIADLLGMRVARLPAPVRTLLLAVALSADAHLADLELIADRRTLDEALELGVLHVDGERVRTSHPMLASVARTRARQSERRAAHRVLADSARDDQERALHLAFATDGQDAELAATVVCRGRRRLRPWRQGRGGGARRAGSAPDARRRR